MSKKTLTLKGNCFICGKNAAKTAMKNHVIKEHNTGDEKCYLIKAEGVYSKDYWLLFSVPLTATLDSVGKFLCEIWCECCGHMSGFRNGGQEIGKSRKMSALNIGDKLVYEYDYGSTTEILVTIVSEVSRPKQRAKIQLLARNEPFSGTCDICGAPAINIDSWENTFVCAKCTKEVKDDMTLLPIVNSPRMGVCGYEGEYDTWLFSPEKYLKK